MARITLSFPDMNRRGGVERILAECALFLARRGHDVHVVARSVDAGLRDGLTVHPVPAVGSGFVLAWSFAQRALPVFAAAHVPGTPYGAFGVTCPPGGVLWVQSVHARWLEISRRLRGPKGRLKQKVNPFHGYILRREQYYFGGRRYRLLLALTDDVARDLEEFYQVPAADILRLPNGYAPTEFSLARRAAERASVRAELGYQEQDRVVIWAGNEAERKGLVPMLEACSQVDGVHLLVAGRVSAEAQADRIARLGMRRRVRFVGSTSDVGRYYCAADYFGMPTQYEAWGLVIVEAVASGLPVLTSRLAGAAEAVQEGHSGFLLDDPMDVGEAVGKLRRLVAGEHGSAEAMAASVERYRWDRVLLEYERILTGGTFTSS
ncbi:MAG TPA: glycosyltransferase family 4 protein [Candidatus Xenobia bacterium]|jgi:UDP-glucose:(heptosyl)LPS alpha-1,3-glucosyltransferase